MPSSPWLLACWFVAVLVFVSKCLCVCWLVGFWMLDFRSLCSKSCDFLALCLRFKTLWHHFDRFGPSMESSRKDTLGSGNGFLAILDGFRDPMMRAFPTLRTELVFCFMFVSNVFQWFSVLSLVVWN